MKMKYKLKKRGDPIEVEWFDPSDLYITKEYPQEEDTCVVFIDALAIKKLRKILKKFLKYVDREEN